MQIILADAKIMRDAVATESTVHTTTPLFLSEATAIAAEMAGKSVNEIAKLFSCSKAIAMENRQRFLSFSGSTAVPAILTYYGQAYKYLKANDFSPSDLTFAQDHVLTMSFLYGLLRPLDLIHLYRMPANVRLNITDGKPLQTWWRDRLTDVLINTDSVDWSSLSDKSQKGNAHICVRLCIDCYADTHFGSGTTDKIKERSSLVHRLHESLQTYRPLAVGAFVRTKSKFYAWFQLRLMWE